MRRDGAIRMCGHWLESLRRLKLSQRRCRAKCKSCCPQRTLPPHLPLHYLNRVILSTDIHCLLLQTACVLSIIRGGSYVSKQHLEPSTGDITVTQKGHKTPGRGAPHPWLFLATWEWKKQSGWIFWHQTFQLWWMWPLRQTGGVKSSF